MGGAEKRHERPAARAAARLPAGHPGQAALRLPIGQPAVRAGVLANATPAASTAAAAAKHRSSRQGAAISCTPIGRGPASAPGQTGAEQAGSPTQEMGWVSNPKLARG